MSDWINIERKKYLNRIKPFINKNIIKVITGQRRVGKSYFLLQVIDLVKTSYSQGQILFINKELEEFAEITDHLKLLNFVKRKSDPKRGKIYLFVDEIQDIKNFEKALRDLQAKENYDIYITGSNAALLSGELSTLLAGRYIEFQMHSLSYQEFLFFHKLENNEGSLMKYIKYGGLPYLINLELKDEIVYEYIKSIYNSIILKDIVARYQIRNVFLLDNLNRFLADNVGSLLSAKRISDFLRSQKLDYSPRIIIDYLTYLTNSYFVHKVRRANLQGRKIFEVNEKYYFEDLGLRHSIIRFTNNDINKVLENLVYKHLVLSGYDVFVGQLGKKEIDFWCEKEGNSIYVQVVYLIPDEKTHQREFGNLMDIKDNFPKYVVSMDPIAVDPYHGIFHMHILDFLNTDL